MNAVVLAAGFSPRFGSPKQLFELYGEPLVRDWDVLGPSMTPSWG
jgi:CTP:molybdopterin cytidylyltransferase MocA